MAVWWLLREAGVVVRCWYPRCLLRWLPREKQETATYGLLAKCTLVAKRMGAVGKLEISRFAGRYFEDTS